MDAREMAKQSRRRRVQGWFVSIRSAASSGQNSARVFGPEVGSDYDKEFLEFGELLKKEGYRIEEKTTDNQFHPTHRIFTVTW